MIMKKKRHIPVLGIDKLYEMHTGSLLSRLQALRECNETRNDGDDIVFDNVIVSKDEEKWKVAYRQVKEVLAGREHYQKKTRRMR
jgi:hypothetical protein